MLVKYPIILAVIFGFILDFFIGDPHFLPHPVRFMGMLISYMEKKLLVLSQSKNRQRMAGLFLVIILLLTTFCVSEVLVFAFYKIHFAAGFTFECLLCYWCIAARDLKKEALNVFFKMESSSIEEARLALSRIVGRDTEKLEKEEIVKASVETVAENSNDGVIAPLFYLLLGGPVCGMLYKAVNTMDSMIGYKNDRYRFFGTFAARCDDVLNFVPARLSALFAIGCCFFLKLNARNAFRIFMRDRNKHESPNSAQTESVYAGALEIRLGGGGSYGGFFEYREFLGDEIKKPCAQNIKSAVRLMYASSVLALLIFCGIRFFVTR